MTESTKPLVAFFGATGGCTASALTLALKAGYTCTALARTPEKLVALLSTNGVSESTIASRLIVTKGDVLDVEAVRKVLFDGDRVAGIIISGIGMYSLLKENTLCTSAISTILAALPTSSTPSTTPKPLILAISTTGITAGPRDVPILFGPLYHILLTKPHHDKRNMEKLLGDEMEREESQRRVRGVVVVRPSFYVNGSAVGEAEKEGKQQKVRVGEEKKPAVGYTITREDVGRWIFENVVRKEGGEWVGRKVSLTY